MPMNLARKLAQRLARVLWLDRAGFGRPIAASALDAEYKQGHWDHFFSRDELPRNLVLAGLIHDFYPKPRVLDVGCGSGRLASLFQVYPFERYLGLDVSAEGLARARALGLSGAEFAAGDYETWETAETFDAIAFNECIGYARDPAATLARFSRFLRPGGTFFLSHYRFGNYAAQWRRMERLCPPVYATAVMSAQGQVWDIRALRPTSAAPTHG